MTVTKLVWRNVMRHPVRAALTFGFSALALFLFVFLFSVITTLGAAVKVAASDRLAVQSAVSLFVYMPVGYRQKIEQVDGVESLEPWNWFGGEFRDEGKSWAQFAVDMPVLLAQYPEFEITGSVDELLKDRQACLVGEEIAAKFGWKIGSRVPLRSSIYSAGDGKAWEFNLVALYRSRRASLDNRTMFFHWDRLQEMRRALRAMGFRADGQDVGVFMVKVKEGYDSKAVAEAIDRLFESGPQKTRTQTEAAFQAQFVSMLGNVPALLGAIGSAVLFAIFFSVLNATGMAARERSKDVGILKALGFSDRLAARLLLAESMAVVGVGGLVGIGCAFLTAPFFRGKFGMQIPNYFVESRTALLGAALAIGIGFVGGLLPAVRLARLKTVDVLREGA